MTQKHAWLPMLTRAALLAAITLLASACQYLPGPAVGGMFGSVSGTVAALEATGPATLPAATPQPTPIPAPVLAAQEMHRSSPSPKYTVDARWPELQWGGDPRVTAFNQAAEIFASGAVKSFIEGVEAMDDPSLADYSSSLRIDFEPLHSTDGILSVLFKISYYSAGAAHPGNFTHALNYDLQRGQMLSLAALFQPDAPYLQALSAYCTQELKARDVLFWEEGALPKPDNYQVWNLTPQGLQITFDEYQVAPYAAGAQTVLVPYAELSELLRPDGPPFDLPR